MSNPMLKNIERKPIIRLNVLYFIKSKHIYKY